ncbi:alpha/beta hydrolase [Actinokineospora diospyrosa]|uniref:Lysophospholipase, alpha-beta hydrolase superfamily n=1 Tax=Actinokineospora diospyrosa TaxID=103728 RepID=A0ABT1IFN5_9PSEU|nr:lysophospholipase [Actinokineospora diospyrosa]MCP2271468.1 Lysophospholipase, alpha-beta hydrolase superfamily [Actinokineospora diospyrosa]
MTRHWTPPAGMAARGTAVVLTGRGEHPGVYQRFGTRLAKDGYRVVATSAEQAPEAIARITGTVVLVGSDIGAVAALSLADVPGVDAVVIAGLPHGAGPTLPWAEELAERTSCPDHRALLEGDREFVRGALNTEPDLALATEIGVPALFLHGGADAVADIAVASVIAERVGARFVEVPGGKHDVLNDLDHDSVATEVVEFLERVRTGAAVLARA